MAFEPAGPYPGYMWPLLAILAADPAPAPVTAPEPPAWAAGKRRLSPGTLAKKKTGAYVNAIPLSAYDPDRGVGYGVRVYGYENGRRDDSFFAVSPYRQRVFVQFFQTTGGLRSHAIKWDAPYLFDTPYRVRAALAYERDTAAAYYGTGDEAWRMRLRENTAFHHVDILRPKGNIHLERDAGGGRIRPLAGFQAARVWLYAGRRSKLAADHAAGRIHGFGGGWANTVKAGVAYDTRDYEPNPAAGVFHDVTAQAAHRAIGAAHEFARVNLALRGYVSPLTESASLTLAGRALVQEQWGGVPFYELGVLTTTQGDDMGLGGLRTLRGYPESRFIGRTMALANLELRWTFAETVLFGSQRFAFMAAPFADAGRVADGLGRLSLRGWRAGAGAGLRVAWNLATILVIDYGVGDEGGALYVNFGLTY